MGTSIRPPKAPSAASQVSVNVGVPPRVFPIALTGGDRWVFAHDDGDLFALVLGFLVGSFAVRVPAEMPRPRARALRFLGGVALAGLWLVSEGFFVLSMIALGAAGLLWLVSRVLHGAARVAAFMILGSVLALVALGTLTMSASRSRSTAVEASRYSDVAPTAAPVSAGDRREIDGKAGNWNAQKATEGVLEGVTPVALTLPSTARSLTASRELVTRDRPFRPVLVYVRDWAVLPLGLLWLAALAVLAWAHRGPAGELHKRIRERLLREPAPPAPPTPKVDP